MSGSNRKHLRRMAAAKRKEMIPGNMRAGLHLQTWIKNAAKTKDNWRKAKEARDAEAQAEQKAESDGGTAEEANNVAGTNSEGADEQASTQSI